MTLTRSLSFSIRAQFTQLPAENRFIGRVAVLALILALAITLIMPPSQSVAQVRIKDIVDVEGVRDNQLIGYGITVGLNGTGDSINGSPFTEQSLVGMLERLGVNIRNETLRTQNVAAVMVTATLPAFARQGTRIDAVVSSLGDADSLLGGQLLVTPLLGADGEVYAVAQGAISIGGFEFEGQAQQVIQGVPTSGRIASGAIVEREIPYDMAERGSIRLSLRNPDFTTARRVSTAINNFAGSRIAVPSDPATINVSIPPGHQDGTIGLMTDIEQLRVQPDTVARVVVDERTGVIVIGENVRVSTVAVAQGNLTVRITETPQVSQPGPLGEGETEVVPRTEIEIDDGADRQLGIISGGVSLQDLVQGLNSLGVGPRDMISILQSIKASGALQAELEIM